MSKGFVSTMRKGFHMTFENGLTASIQWGAGNYCDNHFPADLDFSFSKDAQSDTAEIAVWDAKDNWLDPQEFFNYEISSDGTVAGQTVSMSRVSLPISRSGTTLPLS